MLKLNAPDRALKIMKRALDVAEVEDKLQDLMNYYDSAVDLAIRTKDYSDALVLLNKSLGTLERVGTAEQINKVALAVIIINLTRDDWVLAKTYWDGMKAKLIKYFKENFCAFKFKKLIFVF
jgi:hypothetical protein